MFLWITSRLARRAHQDPGGDAGQRRHPGSDGEGYAEAGRDAVMHGPDKRRLDRAGQSGKPARGIPAVMVGTSGLELAHAADESVALTELTALARIIAAAAQLTPD